MARTLALAMACLLLVTGGEASSRHAKRAHAAPASDAGLVEAWPELKSDLPPDPQTLFGVLPNGLRYAIKRNLTPTGEVSVRLRVAGGSLAQAPSESGIAHLIEHMTFRGTARIPDGGALKELEGLGLRMGADVNAFTLPTQTYFTFDLPRNDAPTIDNALMLLREMASAAQFSSEALESERQVVLAEKRTRDSPVLHVQMAEQNLVLGDATGALLTPIGDEDVIRQSTPDQLRVFYKKHYRPENTTLIVVGDVDVRSVQADIARKFSDWHDEGPPAPKPAAIPSPSAARVAIVTEPGAPTAVLYSWIKPADNSVDSRERDRRNLVELVGLTIFNFRLSRLAADRDVPLVTALASHTRSRGLPDIHQLNVTYGAKGAVAAMHVASAALARILKDGVTQDELDRATADLQSLFDAAATAGPTTPSKALADSLLRAVDDDASFLTPEQAANLYRSEMKDLSTSEVTTALRDAFSGSGPSVLVSGWELPAGGTKAIADALAAAPAVDAETAVPPPPQRAIAQWPYASFGAAGTVVASENAKDLGVTLAKFANGVSATIKPTQFRSGQILVAISFGHGRMGLPKEHPMPIWALPATFPLGGLRLSTFDELSTRFEAQFVDVRFLTRDDAFELSGNTRPKDFDTELQLLAAYVAEPGWRSDAFDKARALEFLGIGRAQSTPDGVLSRNASALLHDGDPRWNVPDLHQIRNADLKATRDLVSAALRGPLEITVVGDISVESAVKSLAATFGALPQRQADTAAPVGDERFAHARAEPLVLRHDGNVSQAAAEIDWQTTGAFPDPQQSRDVRVLQDVLMHRLYDELRTRDGITYSPQTDVQSSLVTPGFGYLSAVADIPPEKIDAFYAAVSHVVDDLKSQPIAEDELARARDPRVSDLMRDQQTNEYWLTALEGAHSDPRRLDAIRTTVAGLKAVTARTVQQAAQTYLRDDRAFKVVVVSKDFAGN